MCDRFSAPEVAASEEEEAFSPASSVASAMSLTSDGSPVPSPQEQRPTSTASTVVPSRKSTAAAAVSTTANLSECAIEGGEDAEEDEGEDEVEVEEVEKLDNDPPRKRPRFRDAYEAQLQQSLAPFTSLPPPPSSSSSSSTTQTFPKPTHRSAYDERLQGVFGSLVARADADRLAQLLRHSSELIDVDKFDSEGRTALHRFCLEGRLNLVKLLVRYGADVTLRTREGWSMIHIASFSGNSEMLMYLLKCSSRSRR